MSEQTTRKEPTFGGTVNSNKPEHTSEQKLPFSLRSNISPGHTFTPVMKRPTNVKVEEPSIEEKVQQAVKNEENSATVSKNAGFAFAPVVENSDEPAQTTASQDASKVQGDNSMERVIPTASTAKRVEGQKSSPKYRRLILVILLALALILVIFLLKPKAPETVAELQQQGMSLPIEFRPVDESEAKRAEEEAKVLQESHQTQANESAAAEVAAAQEPMEQPPVQVNQPTVELPAPAVSESPVVIPAVKKPNTTGSVIYQPEANVRPTVTHSSVARSNVERVEHKVEKVKSAPSAMVKAEAKVESRVEKAHPAPVVVKVKPEVVKSSQPTKAVTANVSSTMLGDTSEIVSTKTMVVPKGVSLMQVFRDHALNISDVNAMSKVNNIVSNLKVGEKITVRLDKDNRVVEMIIGSGGRFIRQSNGVYLYK